MEEIYVVTNLYTNRLKITGLFVCFLRICIRCYYYCVCMYDCISFVHITFVYIIITEEHIKYL